MIPVHWLLTGITMAIIDIAGPLGIFAHDHMIVGKNGRTLEGRS
jgi:hypothetical protein